MLKKLILRVVDLGGITIPGYISYGLIHLYVSIYIYTTTTLDMIRFKYELLIEL